MTNGNQLVIGFIDLFKGSLWQNSRARCLTLFGVMAC